MAAASLGAFNFSGGQLADAIAAQRGYTTADQQAAFGAWTPDKWGTGLSPELLRGITQQGWTMAPGADMNGSVAQFNVSKGQPTYDTDADGHPLPATAAPTEIAYHPQGQGAGENYYIYDGDTGKFLRNEKGSGIMSYAQGIGAVAGAGLGFGALGAAAGGGAAAGAGGGAATGAGGGVTGFGDAGTMYAGSNAADAASLGGGGSMYGGAGAGMGGGAAAFSPAGDSQLASTQLGITGDQAAADAAAGPIPSVTVNGAPSGYGGPSLTDALRTASKVYGQMGQQHSQAQMPVYSSSQDQRPSTFLAPTPGFAPIASQLKRAPMLGGLNGPWNPYMTGLMGGNNA